MSPPWMPLYIADYRADTSHLSAAEHGGYLLLIMHYWQKGGLPSEDKQLARIACMTPTQWKAAKKTIAKLFQDGWRHKRIDEELAHAADVIQKRKAAVEEREKKRRSHDPSSDPSLDPSHDTSKQGGHDASHVDTTTSTLTKEKKDIAPNGASTTASRYAFEGGVIKLNKKDFDKWQQAFSYLDLRAELVALEYWAGKQPDWFHAVKHALAKRNREQKTLAEKNENGSAQPYDWRRAAG